MHSQGSTLSPATVARGLVLNRRMEWYSVCAEGTRLRALASVRIRSGPRAWEVQCLHSFPEAVEEVTELLERLCIVAGEHGGERVFLRVPTSSPVVEAVKRAGFLPYAQETLYRLESPPSAISTPVELLRPCIPADEYDLFRLYNASAPSVVRSAYAITFDEWRDARDPSEKRERQGLYEDQECLRGWVRVANRKQHINRMELMLHPEEKATVWEHLVGWGLQQGEHGAPFLALVSDHQSSLASVLGESGFRPVGEYLAMVKSVAIRVKDSALAPAGA